MTTAASRHARTADRHSLDERREVRQSGEMIEVEGDCPGCGRVVRCSASAAVTIEFERLQDGRFIAWATAATREPLAEITVDTEESSGGYSYPEPVSMFGLRITSLHECSFGGDADDRAGDDPPPRRDGSIQVDRID